MLDGMTNDILDQFELDPDETPTNPPRDDHRNLICGRECTDGSPCEQKVSVPFIACLYHDNHDPVI